MSTPLALPITLKAVPASWDASKQGGSISTPNTHSVFPAGPSFIRSTVRKHLQRSFEEDDEVHAEHASHLAAQGNGEEVLGPDFDGLGEEDEDQDTLNYDPKEWKKQDHYAVLGLHNLRYQANDDHIRVAHRRKVLRHHPDKKANSGDANNDSFFKCIQKAHETLTNPEKRRQFDSADEMIEDAHPAPSSVKPADFIKVFAPVFASEGRFSKKQPVPSLGTMESTKQEVEKFYDFWYKIDSWRSFEWWDKEVNEGSDSRDDKRFQEKKNKTERARRKREDNVRLRELVDDVLAADPRMKRFRIEEKQAREAKKNAGKTGGASPADLKAKKEEEERQKVEAAKAAEDAKKAEADDKVTREAAKKAREAAKKNLKKYKKTISAQITALNYFQPAGTAPSASVIEATLNELDALVAGIQPEEVKTLKEDVEAGGEDPAKVKAALAKWAGKVEGGKFVQFA